MYVLKATQLECSNVSLCYSSHQNLFPFLSSFEFVFTLFKAKYCNHHLHFLEGLTEFNNIIMIPPQLLWNSKIHSQTSLSCISAFRRGSYNVIILMSHEPENIHISSSKLTMAWEVSRQLNHVYLATFFFFFTKYTH